MLKKYLFESLGFFGIMTCILFGFLISNVVASEASTSHKTCDEKIDQILQNVQVIKIGVQQDVRKELSIQNQLVSFVYNQNESSEGYTAPVSFSSEGYASCAEDVKRQQRLNQYK